MVSEVSFRKGLLDEIRARAAADAQEVCGLLLGRSDRVTQALHCRNVAADPGRSFEIDPAQLIAALRAERAGGARVVGCYHSHPSGPPEPSPRDADAAAPNGWLWLIVGGDGTCLYRAVHEGTILGRFDPLPSPDRQDGKGCATPSASPQGRAKLRIA
jgi:proteasome lid subunit RPN8/RPN11